MEDRIAEFVKDINGQLHSFGYGDGQSCGAGYGYGGGDGGGYCSGFGDRSGSGCSYDVSSGYSDGYGDTFGNGNGYGNRFDAGFRDFYGSGVSSNGGISSYNGNKVYYIDGIPTVIKHVKGNVAKGFMLNSDLTMTPCYVVKERGYFAHGNTLREAYTALQEKLHDNPTEEERLKKFKDKFPDFSKKYPAYDLFSWHHVLTGSCKAGREAFCRDNDIDINKDSFTIYEFVELTKNSYGGKTILKLLN